MSPLLFLDLEYTCWPRHWLVNWREEIVEIGMVCVGDDLQKSWSYRTYVRPYYHSHLSQYCLDLLQIRQSCITNAPTFDVVWHKIRSRMLERMNPLDHFIVATWGAKDSVVLRDEWSYYNVPLSERFHPNQFIDFEKIYRNMLKIERSIKSPHRVSLQQAARNEGVSLESTRQHNALYDAELLHRLAQRIPIYLQGVRNNDLFPPALAIGDGAPRSGSATSSSHHDHDSTLDGTF